MKIEKQTLKDLVKETALWAGRLILVSGVFYVSCQVLKGCAQFSLKQIDRIEEYYSPKSLELLGDVNKDGFEEFKVNTNNGRKYIFSRSSNGTYISSNLEKERK